MMSRVAIGNNIMDTDPAWGPEVKLRLSTILEAEFKAELDSGEMKNIDIAAWEKISPVRVTRLAQVKMEAAGSGWVTAMLYDESNEGRDFIRPLRNRLRQLRGEIEEE